MDKHFNPIPGKWELITRYAYEITLYAFVGSLIGYILALLT